MAPTTLIRELNSLKKDFEDGMAVGSVRRGKRERVANRILEPNSCGNATKKRRKCSTQVEELIPDEDYETFLSSLADHGSDVYYIDNKWLDDRNGGDVNVNDRSVDDGDHSVEVRSLDGGVDGDGVGVGDEDPDYKILLDKLTKGGKSFTNNRSVDDGDDDDVYVNGRYAGDGDENIQSSDDCLDDEDPQYKIFLEKLRQDGKSYVLEVVGDNGKSEVIKYEQENEILDGPDPDTPETLKKSQVKEKADTQSTLRRGMKRKCTNCLKNSALPVNKEVIVSPRTVKYDMRKENRPILEKSSMKKEKKKNVNEKAANGSTRERPFKTPPVEADHFTMQGCANEKAAKGSTKRCPVKRPRMVDLRFAKQGCKRGLEDEDYTKLLSCIKFDDGQMVYSPPNGRPVILGDDGESSPRYRSSTSFTAVDVDSGRCVKTCDASQSQFRKGLMDILTRPYDYEEYRSLLKEATHQKPLGQNRNLRSGTRTYPVEGKLAPSYLKQHIVLRRKITAARGDRPRVLNLLRGFFYWLKNVAQDESFCPWNDSSCLKVLPPSDKKTGLAERGLEGKTYVRVHAPSSDSDGNKFDERSGKILV